MDPTTTIYKALWNYPTLWFESGRAGVLHHMFFVIGNGYDWVNGELVDHDDDRDVDYDPWAGRDDEIAQALRADYKRKVTHVRQNISSYLEGPGTPRSLYPLSEYAKIVTIPDDVTDRWLETAIEAYNMYASLYRSVGYMVPDGVQQIWKPLNSITARLRSLAQGRRLAITIKEGII